MAEMSELPEPLLQHIQSFLPMKEAARTILVSKPWFRAWSTRSVLVFDQTNHLKRFKSKPFHQVVNDTLATYQQQGLRIHKISLNIDLNCCTTASLVDQWLRFSLTNNVSEIDLGTCSVHSTNLCALHPSAFTANSLTRLALCGLSLVLEDELSFTCANLTKLILEYVSLSDHTFLNFASSFPSLELLHLMDCTDLKKVRVANLPRLKEFKCDLTCEVRQVCIDAPKLEYFSCGGLWATINGRLNLSIEPSHTLRVLELNLTAISGTELDTLLSQSPILEDLSLGCCFNLEVINVSSHSLKCFSIQECNQLTKVKINAPNLSSLSLEFSHMLDVLNLSFVTPPTKLAKSKATVVTRYLRYIDRAWFLKLGSLVTKFKEFDLSIKTRCVNTLTRKDFRAVAPLPDHDLQELRLNAQLSKSLPYPVAISGLFSTCHPKTVVVFWDISQEKLVKCLCNELLRMRKLKCWLCDRVVNCWQNYLEDAYLEIFSVNQGKWIHLHWKRFVAGLKNLEHGTEIRFSLKWCSAEY